MIGGHGDDAFRFGRPMVSNFSSNVYGHVDLTALKAHLRDRIDAIGHYPEPEPYTLEATIAARLGIDSAAVCVTNGATEAIYLTAHAFAGSQSAILQPTFSEYADACRLYAHSVAPVFDERGHAPGATGTFFCCEHSQKKNHGCSTRPAHASLIEESSPLHSLVWLCNPNNPTGTVIPKDELLEAMEENPETIFIIDQSYGFFTKEPLLTAAEAVGRPNVIQLHSMTKRYAMPGLRLGYITAHPALIERIRAVRMPWSVNALAIEAGLYLAANPDTAPIDLPALLQETARLREALNALLGLSAATTQTHFFLCHLAKGSAADLKQWLAEQHGILIRDASNFESLDERHFRIATQTPIENDALVAALRQYLEERR